MHIAPASASALACILLLAGCAGTPAGSGGSDVAPLPAAPSGRVTSAPLPGGQAAPPVEMAGRWTLTSTAGGACAMNFRAAPGAAEGAIAPEGGCPGSFFTSRKWTFEASGLVIRDHTGKPLAQLAAAGPSRFEGKASAGAGLTLSR